jgi:nicotinate-nucleotide adenylyltransferase
MTLGVLGGTFDPIHYGHITAGLRAQAALNLDRVVAVPSRIPPHRPTPAGASPADRLAMVQLAAAEYAGWSASDVELRRDGPSYTFDTLTELRANATSGTFFIIGADAFAEIATWWRYPALLDLAHFVVVARPGITLHSLQTRVPDLADRMTTPDVFKRPTSAKASAFAEATADKSVGKQTEPDQKTRVILIETDTPDVSSTEIRQRVRAGQDIRGLVPDSVAAYISSHRLYMEATL